MLTLYRKELNSFFNSLTGYVVIIVFLVTNSLFLWIFDNNYNVLESGYANIDALFDLSPWFFLFLVPAITMGMFADERRTGTLELLLTRPLSNIEIVIAKYLTSITIILFSIIPTLIYFLTIYLLGNPVGSVDTGGTWGSYIGLFFLASVYASIGLYSSSLTENQIISFIISAMLSFLLFFGFDKMSTLDFFRGFDLVIVNIGINEHYESMSRGVLDSRDLIYFISLNVLFVALTKSRIDNQMA